MSTGKTQSPLSFPLIFLFQYGPIANLLVSSRKNGSAVVEFGTSKAAVSVFFYSWPEDILPKYCLKCLQIHKMSSHGSMFVDKSSIIHFKFLKKVYHLEDRQYIISAASFLTFLFSSTLSCWYFIASHSFCMPTFCVFFTPKLPFVCVLLFFFYKSVYYNNICNYY